MPIEVTNTPADDSLAVKLSEMEARLKRGWGLSSTECLDLITTLRQYMAHSETIERSVEAMSKSLGGHV